MRALNKTVYVKIEHILIRPQIYVKKVRTHTHTSTHTSYAYMDTRQPEGELKRTWRNDEDTHARTQIHLSVQNCTKVI